ncbi:MAG: 3-dehydroquinate synthase family protein, partial [Pseudomonadota bacterium]
NLIGTFYQPQAVIADTNLLLNLPKRELLAGYAEVVKYGIIADYPFFVWLEEHGEKALAGDLDALAHIVHESCKIKAEIVSGDEKEAGLRATLNFGHTLGHALESETGYSDKLLHGEAVAIGSLLAMRLSVARNLCSVEDYDRVKKHFEKIGLPTEFAGMDSNRLIEHCYRDKKAKDGKLTFILSQGIGKSVIVDDVSEQELQDLLS